MSPDALLEFFAGEDYRRLSTAIDAALASGKSRYMAAGARLLVVLYESRTRLLVSATDARGSVDARVQPTPPTMG